MCVIIKLNMYEIPSSITDACKYETIKDNVNNYVNYTLFYGPFCCYVVASRPVFLIDLIYKIICFFAEGGLFQEISILVVTEIQSFGTKMQLVQ